MTTFLLNHRLITTNLPAGSTLLDFIRYEQGLMGTKIGCREGDCGACTVLEGRLEDGRIVYRSIVSCLTPLGNVHGKHIVTVEGLNMDVLSPVQQAFVDHHATQCGFCTPGFVVALTGHAMKKEKSDPAGAIASMDGNICRCTGYKSIERAAVSISKLLQDKDPDDPVSWLVGEGFLSAYFLEVPARLQQLREQSQNAGQPVLQPETSKKRAVLPGMIGGGTDMMVQRPDYVEESDLLMVAERESLKGIRKEANIVYIGAAATAADIMESPVMAASFPHLKTHFKLISSTQIRHMGTLAGNLVNASPIGDLSIFFLALDALVEMEHITTGALRSCALKSFFLDYKKLDLRDGEIVSRIAFKDPPPSSYFNFEKVSKRTHLDIASVNSACYLELKGDRLSVCRISFGGVAPIPLLAEVTAHFLLGRQVDAATLTEAANILQKEISPISDVRGSEAYKRLLARQLLFSHFIRLFPGLISLKDLNRGGQHA